MSTTEHGDRLVKELSHYVCASYPWGWERKHSDPTDLDDLDENVMLGELIDRRRIDKVVEEAGEVSDAYGSYVGENPRKAHNPAYERKTRDDVKTELLDVALTALGAWEHLTGHAEGAVSALIAHAVQRHERAGLAPVLPAACQPAEHLHLGPWQRVKGSDQAERCLSCGTVAGK